MRCMDIIEGNQRCFHNGSFRIDGCVSYLEAGVEMSMEPVNAAALAGVEEEIIQLQQAAIDLHKKKRDMESLSCMTSI